MRLFIFVTFLLLSLIGWSQEMIRFSGVVLDSDELKPVFGTTILNQTKGSGAVSDTLGFFSIRAKTGDTLLFSDIRYIKTQFVIPAVLDGSDYGVIQLLIRNEVMLDEVEVYSFPTEEDFKASFMEVNLDPNMEMKVLDKKRELMKTVRQAYENERYYYENWADRRLYDLTGQIPPNHLLDPIRWTNFIKDNRQKIGK